MNNWGEKMKISTEIGSASKIVGEEKAIEYIAKAGFDAWDFSMFKMCDYNWLEDKFVMSSHPLAGNDYLKFAKRLKQIGLDNGIICNQSHAPFPSSCREVQSYFMRAIECTAEAGGEICVIHPDNRKTAYENAEMYIELLPFAKQCNVKIATENMWEWNKEKDEAMFAACATPEDFIAHLNAIKDDFFVGCLDIGHAEMKGLNTNSIDMIKTLDSKLAALHVHDNDKWHDSHQIPFSMNIEFKGIARALKDIDYKGYITLEADKFLIDYTEKNIVSGLLKMAESAKKFAEMICE